MHAESRGIIIRPCWTGRRTTQVDPRSAPVLQLGQAQPDSLPLQSGAAWREGNLGKKKRDTRSSFTHPVIIAANLLGQLEVDGDLRLNLDRLAIEQIGLVLPLFDRICGGLRQLRIAAQHFHLGDVTVF